MAFSSGLQMAKANLVRITRKLSYLVNTLCLQFFKLLYPTLNEGCTVCIVPKPVDEFLESRKQGLTLENQGYVLLSNIDCIHAPGFMTRLTQFWPGYCNQSQGMLYLLFVFQKVICARWIPSARMKLHGGKSWLSSWSRWRRINANPRSAWLGYWFWAAQPIEIF